MKTDEEIKETIENLKSRNAEIVRSMGLLKLEYADNERNIEQLAFALVLRRSTDQEPGKSFPVGSAGC